ncbi:copper resistance protein NlpE [Rhodanobacter denitrificans]|uniref:Putative lipoprotein NlpE involved in copper resistance n=1 Tax=Rhodanobacter denitrificans TaxID=666685 RepID=M4NE29_9GAMM|nr:copper resistance protein NlpE N-terminal domain-containing protein [Rhodanobacter denitrificans]AGG87753.1 putative lipoprotein NlpE involved in copper resistance [Rhodanobacter denitrificans]UJM86920.1 copper resistance protein NlpE N-terminal domain-containing protein [Rhodanobacter denitrificans]
MKLNVSVLTATFALGLAACSAPSNQAPAVSHPAGDTTPSSDILSAQAFAGKFAGTIACGDCQGIQTKLQLNADGSYMLDETFAGRATNNFLSSQGHWQIQDSHHFVLIPNAQDWEHRPFETLNSNDIRQLGKDGKPYTNDAAYHLKRVLGTSAH